MIARLLLTALVGMAVLSMSMEASADPVPLTPFLAKDFGALGATTEVKPLLSSDYDFNSTFMGQIRSSVWSLSSGDYVYLYQAVNYGPSVLEILGVAPFYGIKEAGYISSSIPDGYLIEGMTPAQIPSGSGNYAVTYDETGGANVTFGYYSFVGGAVPGGQHTVVLYLVSPYEPVSGYVHAIDSGVATAASWTTAVPEPGSMLVLGGGLATLALRRRAMRRR